MTTPASGSPRNLGFRLLELVCALVFLFQPLVVFIASYEPRDCDDKAVHFFAAMYFRASAADREALRVAIEPFVRDNQAYPGWWRTDFRFQTVGTYPLTNLMISLLHAPDRHYTESVKWGLLTVTMIALLTIVWIGSRTPFGFWQTVLVLNLIALHSIPADFLIGAVPARQHPFVTYVPRGAAGVMMVATILAFAARKWSTSVLSVLLLFLWHTALGLLNAAIAMTAVGLFWLVNRSRISRLWADEFYPRALVLAVLVLSVVRMLSAIAAIPRVAHLFQIATGVSPVSGLSLRLTGMSYSLVVLIAVLGARNLYGWARQRLGPQRYVPVPNATAVAVALLLALGLTHLALYARLLRKQSAFFQPQCQQASVIALPENVSALSVHDEPTLFSSLGHYLFRLRERVPPD